MPVQVDADDHDRQREIAPRGHEPPQALVAPGRLLRDPLLGSLGGLQVLRADRGEPEDDPGHPAGADDQERPPPRGRVALDQQLLDRLGRDDRPQRRAALEQAVAQRPVAGREEQLDRLQPAGEMTGLEHPQEDPEDQQLAIRVAQAGEEPHRRPPDQDDRVEPVNAHPVDQPAEQQAPDREGHPEAELGVAVLLVVEREFPLDLDGQRVDRQPVHVVDDRGQQEQDADVPPPGRRPAALGEFERGPGRIAGLAVHHRALSSIDESGSRNGFEAILPGGSRRRSVREGAGKISQGRS